MVRSGRELDKYGLGVFIKLDSSTQNERQQMEQTHRNSTSTQTYIDR